ncbi:ATPase [Novosphingobium sp.]|uniref:ATPase n=1 Tax=Novosphingobium sp. TaxID=1874826 RepID=UPI00286B9857|nr:ATPase [Novosphingobium sp.]
MSQGTRIAAVETSAASDGVTDEFILDQEVAEDAPAAAEDWWEQPAKKPRRWPFLLAGLGSAALLAAWTALFVYSNFAAMQARPELAQWTAWIRDWSVPVLLLAVAWLLAMRNSRREATRFGETASLLADESAKLEQRLTAVNRELSLAREFIAAQTRDIDALGRVSVERLSQHADKLVSLIHDNGTRIDAIADVSAAALDNMEKLRNQLPVIASSAKDVTNNIGAAGRTAHGQIEELVSGFNKLNQFGQASELQVKTLKDLVDQTIGEFTAQADQLGAIAAQRFAALGECGEQARADLDTQEVAALAAIRSRASALDAELAETRAALDAKEAESLTSLRARLSSVRDESAVLARALRDAESGALDSWKAAIASLETDLRTAIEEVGEIDRKAMESAQSRLAELRSEAEEVDRRLTERDQQFATELEKRQAELDIRHESFVSRLTGQMDGFETAVARHQTVQDQQFNQIAEHGERLGGQLGSFAALLDTLSGQGEATQQRLADSLTEIETRLTASQRAMGDADQAISGLTDNSVRLLELIQASVQHSRESLPAAMQLSEARLTTIEGRFDALTARSAEALSQGEALAAQADASKQSITAAAGLADELRGSLASDGSAQAKRVADLQAALATVRAESRALALETEGELTKAIVALNTSARDAVAGIETMSADAIAKLAARLGDEGGAAMEAALRERAGQVIDEVEATAAKASSASREAAVQLRDQLSKVNELAGNLERRVAHARSRAEEKVDNDFARRVALITESLNSNAIDIARTMDHEVSDTAWAAYLKGDRGIFTRRAVRLLDAPEAKAVAQLYENDRDFRDHVSRYIHDFEAMLRELLSTRDGHSLGVTLLSSDMGKLYVALAQAIERLRN